MIVLSGASASGKTEVAKELTKKYKISKIITTTTRQMRNGEVNGRDYFFVSVKQFEKMIKDGLFVEYTIFNGNYYGSTKDQIASNKCIVVDPNGLVSYIALKDKHIVTFFLESTEETRRERMRLRGDKDEDAENRIINDRTAFDPKTICKVNFHIDSEHYNVEEVTDEVYKLYSEFIKER